MKKVFLLASLLAMTLIGGSCSDGNETQGNITYIYNDVDVDENDQKGLISGIVTCLGNPVSGVTITYNDKTAYSMLDGTFKLRSVDLADGKVTFAKEGYYDFRAKLNVEEIMEKKVTINCDMTTISLVKGSVKDTWGNALVGASVSIEGSDISTSSDSNGNYVLTGLTSSDFMLLAKKDGYQTDRHLVRKEWFSDGVLDSFNFECHKLGKLSGKITDSSSGAALIGVKVMCGSDISYSDANGNYELKNIYPENKETRDYKGYEVEYSLSGYTSSVQVVDFYSETNFEKALNVSLIKQ